jgi:hypothetical protein
VYHTLTQCSTESDRGVMFAYLDEVSLRVHSPSRTISSGIVGIASPSRLSRRCPSITSLSVSCASNAIGDTLPAPRLPSKKRFSDERSEFILKGIDSYTSIRVLKKFSDPKKIFLPPGATASLPIKKFPYKE